MDRLIMDQPVFLWFCKIKMCSRDLKKRQINNAWELYNPCELNDSCICGGKVCDHERFACPWEGKQIRRVKAVCIFVI